MELRVLKYFLMTAREENITKAAALLHITQPTLSRQLMQLEEEPGVKLFYRSKHRIILTEDGMLLKRRAKEMVSSFRTKMRSCQTRLLLGAEKLKVWCFFQNRSGISGKNILLCNLVFTVRLRMILKNVWKRVPSLSGKNQTISKIFAYFIQTIKNAI